MFSGKQRAALRRAAHGEKPVFQIGKDGVDASLVDAVQRCIAARELIKLRVLQNSPITARQAADALQEATGAEVVGVVGSVLTIFKQRDKESRYTEVV